MTPGMKVQMKNEKKILWALKMSFIDIISVLKSGNMVKTSVCIIMYIKFSLIMLQMCVNLHHSL